MKEAVIVDAVRTPMGRHGGILKSIRPDDLAAFLITKLLQKTGTRGEEVEDVFMGCTNQAGEDSRNVARNASLLAGLPYAVPGVTINRLCGSGLEAVNQAGRAIQTDQGELFIAGGVESMTRGPWVMGKSETAFQRGDVTVYDSSLGWRFPNLRLGELYPLINNGETAENVAEKYRISRQDQDALRRHECPGAAAQRIGVFERAEGRGVGGKGTQNLPAVLDRNSHRATSATKTGETVQPGSVPSAPGRTRARIGHFCKTARCRRFLFGPSCLWQNL